MEIPAWNIIYRVKPLAERMDYGYYMRTQDFGCGFGAFIEESYGLTRYSRMEVSDSKAFHTEPSMPPESQARRWALGVEPQEVVHGNQESGERGKVVEAGVGAMPVVMVEPG